MFINIKIIIKGTDQEEHRSVNNLSDTEVYLYFIWLDQADRRELCVLILNFKIFFSLCPPGVVLWANKLFDR